MAQMVLVDEEWLVSVEEKLDKILEAQTKEEPDPNGTISADKVAEILGVTTNTVYIYTRKGLIPVLRLGNKCRYRRKDVYEFIGGGKY